MKRHWDFPLRGVDRVRVSRKTQDGMKRHWGFPVRGVDRVWVSREAFPVWRDPRLGLGNSATRAGGFPDSRGVG